jgi:serine/threonine-protein kinase
MNSPDLTSLVERVRSARLFRVLGVYAIASWAVLQAIDLLASQFGLPPWFFPIALGLLLVGFPIVLATALMQSRPAPCDEVAVATQSAKGQSGLGRLLTWRGALTSGTLAFVALATIGAGVVWLRNSGRDLRPDAVAVMPFHVIGTEETQLWREGLVDLLATALDATGEFHSSDPRAVLNRWRAIVPDPNELAEPEKAAEVAGSLGAGRVILGSLIQTAPNEVRLAADLYSVRWLRKEASVSVEGSEDQMTELIDELTLELLRSVWEGDSFPEVRVSAMTTASIPALRSYLEGEQAFRHSQFADAQAAFSRAVEEDSTFAIAYYRLAQTYGWFRGLGASEVPRYLAAAERHSQDLPARDSLLVRGWKLADVDGSLQAIPLFRDLVNRFPDDLEAWHGLGDAEFHMGSQAGHPITAAVAPLEQSLALDSTFAPALIHLIEIAYREGDAARGIDWTTKYLALDSTSLYAQSFRLLTPLQFGTPRDSARAAAALDTADTELLSWMMGRLRASGPYNFKVFQMVSLEAAEERFNNDDRAMALADLGLAHLRHGQASVTAKMFEQLLSMTSEGHDMEPWVLNVMATALEMGVAADSVSIALVKRISETRELPYAALSVSSMREDGIEKAEARVVMLEGYADTLMANGDTARSRSTRGQSLTLRGRMAAAHDSVDAAIDYLRRGLAMINATWTWPRDLDRYLLANLIEDRGGEEEAMAIYGSLYWSPFSEALGYFHRAEIHERRGEREEAVRYYVRFLSLWGDADEHLQPRVETAKSALERLRGERIAS